MGRALFMVWLAGLTGLVVYAVFGLRPGPSEADYRRLDEDIAAYMAQRWERVPELGGGVSGTAFDHYVESLRWGETLWDAPEMEEGWEETDAAIEALRYAFPGSEEEPPPRLVERLGAGSSGFDGLTRGARARFVTPPPGLYDTDERGSGPLAAAIRLARFVSASVPVLVREHRPELAVDRLVALHQFGLDFASGNTVFGSFIGLTLAQGALLRLGDLVASDSLSPAEVERVRSWAERLPRWAPPERRLFEGELLELRSTLLHDLWEGADSIPFADQVFADLGLDRRPSGTGRGDYFRYPSLVKELEERYGGEPEPLRSAFRAAAASPPSDPVVIWPDLFRGLGEYRDHLRGLLVGIDLRSERERTEVLPAGWALKPIPGKTELGLYPPGAGPDGWVFRMPVTK